MLFHDTVRKVFYLRRTFEARCGYNCTHRSVSRCATSVPCLMMELACKCLSVVVCITLTAVAAADERACHRTLSNTADPLTAPMAMVDLSCETGSLSWTKPNGSQGFTFMRSDSSFRLCLFSSENSSSVAVYRLKGKSRRLVVPRSHEGLLGCYESQCGHVSLLIVPVDNQLGPVHLYYETHMDTRCPKCTESCQEACLCSAPYVLSGEVKKSVFENGQYTHYLKIIKFLRHNGIYIPGSLNLPDGRCSPQGKLAGNFLLLDTETEPEIPKEGLIKIHSRCSLDMGTAYAVAAKIHVGVWTGLSLCCADDDEDYAFSLLEDLAGAEKCCF